VIPTNMLYTLFGITQKKLGNPAIQLKNLHLHCCDRANNQLPVEQGVLQGKLWSRSL
jgi:hypothetical protein